MKRAVLRLPTDTVERVDRLAEKLRAAHPQRLFPRAAVLRALLTSALDVAEADAASIPGPVPPGSAEHHEDRDGGLPRDPEAR